MILLAKIDKEKVGGESAMKKSVFVIITIFASFSFLMLFQNCSQMESKKREFAFTQNGSQSGNNMNTSLPVTDPLPAAANFGPKFTLDNVDNYVATSYSIGFGTGDVFYYETDYRSTNSLTVVTFQEVNTNNIISVGSDSCNKQITMTSEIADEFGALYGKFTLDSEIRVLAVGESVTPNCAFPRFGIDGQGTKTDYELHFSPRECIPEGVFFNTKNVTEVNDWFNSLIDSICSAI